jgi:hypothetical protein
VLAFANVMNFLANEFSRLCGWRLAFALIAAGAFERFLLGHEDLPNSDIDATQMPRAVVILLHCHDAARPSRTAPEC